MRHFMAHGFMSLEVDHRFAFLRYVPAGKGKFTMKSGQADIERLRQAVEDIGAYVSDTVRLFERIYREQKLEPKPPQES
jgi:hypothetical protein